MKCNNCNNKDLAFVEETIDKRKAIINVVTTILIATISVVLLISFKSFDPVFEYIKYICIAMIPTIYVGSRIYLFVKIKTSRTKVICKKCGMWWYLENDKPNTIYVDSDYRDDKDETEDL